MTMLTLRAVLAAAIVAVLGSIWYYAFDVSFVPLMVILVIAVGAAWWVPIGTEVKMDNGEDRGRKTTTATVALVAIAFVALAAWWSVVVSVEITDAVRSPWLVLSPFAIIALGIAMLADIFLFAAHARRTAVALLAAILFSIFAMAAVVYPLGFGFDPFLHRATVAHIAEFGSITPKPLYYVGQYALELVLVVVGNLPLVAVDRFLLPIFATIALIASAVYGLAPLLRKSSIGLAALLLLPFGAFVSTTPQGLAYVFALSAIFLTFNRPSTIHHPPFAPWILAIAALLTHPFAGIPAVLYVAAWHAIGSLQSPMLRRYTVAASGVAALLAIPVLFFVQAARSGLALQFHLGNILDRERWSSLALDGFFRNQFSTWYDGLYLVIDNIFLLAIVIGIIGYVVQRRIKNDRSDKNYTAGLTIIFAAGMFANFILLSAVFDFDFLIAYERSDYAVRALTLTHLFLMPCIVAAFAHADDALSKRPRALRMTMLVLLAAVGMANVYGAYPRHDNYARSAGFNVGTADFNAVAAIATHAGEEENYIVLANQATSAAAVERDGFKKYYHTDIFYYPIPTGGPLYKKFLSMVNDAPTAATMEEAMDIAGVNLAYFAVSDYWWKSEIIVENAKREADDWFAVDGITVFIFQR